MNSEERQKPEAEQTEEQKRNFEEIKHRMEQLAAKGSHRIMFPDSGLSVTMGQEQKIGMVKELRVGLSCKIEEVTSMINLLERGTGARELALVKTKLQEAKHWAGEALDELGHKLPEEFRDEAK